MIYLLWCILWCVIWGAICHAVAKHKGFDTFVWTILGALFGLITLIILLCIHGQDAGISDSHYNNNYDDSPVLKYSLNQPDDVVYKNFSSYSNKKTSGEKWRCTNCGTENPSYLTTCSCGNKKPNKSDIALTESWKCSNCGSENLNSSSTCLCGMQKMYNHKWQCSTCGKINDNDIVICYCGTKKSDSKKVIPIPGQPVNTSEANLLESSSEIEKVDVLLKYKQLLDMGAISEEEFTAKKKELL